MPDEEPFKATHSFLALLAIEYCTCKQEEETGTEITYQWWQDEIDRLREEPSYVEDFLVLPVFINAHSHLAEQMQRDRMGPEILHKFIGKLFERPSTLPLYIRRSIYLAALTDEPLQAAIATVAQRLFELLTIPELLAQFTTAAARVYFERNSTLTLEEHAKHIREGLMHTDPELVKAFQQASRPGEERASQE